MGESKSNCSIFKNNIYGRYLVASRDLKQGEIIFSENPTLIGPPNDGNIICFNCCEYNLNSFVYCSGCSKAIICKKGCLGVFHTEDECKVVKNFNINGNFLIENPQVIFPLRLLLFKQIKRELWDQIMELESHLEVRRETPIWKRHQLTVVNKLEDLSLDCLDTDKITPLTPDLIQKLCGILDVNTFEVRPPQNNELMGSKNSCLRGLYIFAALMAHDCIGNTFLSIDDDFKMIVKASVNIDKNTPIFFNYANVLYGNIERKKHLREGKYFECYCTRCSDPTELSTNISSIKCHKCPQGYVIIKDPKDVKSDWECSNCKKCYRHFLIDIIVDEGRNRIENTGISDFKKLEALQINLQRTFHPNHYLLLEIQQTLIGILSYLPPNDFNLTKKVLICENLLKIFSTLEPGLSRFKAMTLYQLQSAMIHLAHNKFEKKLITLEELFTKLKEAEQILIESVKYLLHEPTKSPEGKITKIALNELKMLRTSIDDVHEDLLLNKNSNTKREFKKKSGHHKKIVK